MALRWKRRKLWKMSGLAMLGIGVVWGGVSLRDRTAEYVPGERAPGLVDSLGRQVPADHPAVRFVDVTAEVGIEFQHFPVARTNRLPEDMGSGVAVGDVNGDGWSDLYLVNAVGTWAGGAGEWARSRSSSQLYLNGGDGTFRDVTGSAGVGLRELGMAAAFADLDGDGDLDLITTAVGTCHVFRNRGDGTFVEHSEAAGVQPFEGFFAGIAVGDYDLDGDVDFYLCRYVNFDGRVAEGPTQGHSYGLEIPAQLNPSAFEPAPNLLFRNRGDATFEEVAESTGVSNPGGRSLEAVIADLNADGWPDLYVANDVSDNALYINQKDGTFLDLTAQALVGDYRGAMGLAVEDYNRDSWFDLFITHWVAQENGLYTNLTPVLAEEGKPPELMFMDDADRVGLGQIALSMVGWATGFFDYDNDGQRDLFVVNGSTIPSRDDPLQLAPMRSQLFWNAGPERGFFDVSPVAGAFFQQEWVGRGGALLDFDLDGDEDLLVMRHGAAPALLRNEGGDARGSVRVCLRQPEGNRFALGAILHATSGGSSTWVQTDSQGSYLSQHAVGEVSFGLGDSPSLDSLIVTWPDGTRNELKGVASGSLVRWTKGELPEVEILPGRRARALQGPQDVAGKKRFFQLLQQATDLRLSGRLPAAVAAYREALKLWPLHEDGLYYLGNLLQELGEDEEALRSFEALVRNHSSSARGWMQIGRIRLPGGQVALDDVRKAEQAFEEAHRLNREESGPIVQLGVVAMIQQDLVRAERLLQDATRLNPRSIEAAYHLGRIAWLRRDRVGADRHLRRAHELAQALGAGDSPSNEGDTRGGRAMLANPVTDANSGLDRWRTVADRPIDLDVEYGNSP